MSRLLVDFSEVRVEPAQLDDETVENRRKRPFDGPQTPDKGDFCVN